MDQENTKILNTTSTPNRNVNLKSKDENLETPNKSSARKSVGSAGGSSSVRRSSRLLKKNDGKSVDALISTPQLGAPGGTPYLLRSKSRETLSSAEANLRRNAMDMPPLNLNSMSNSEVNGDFFQDNLESSNENNNNNKSENLPNIYSTPRKKVRGTEYSSNNNNTKNNEFDLEGDPVFESQVRSSSKRKGAAIKTTPVSKNKRVNDEDSAIKDRKSILKQYDPDGINTSTMNIKTPKSQKKVQFGTKNLIIIDENKQDMNINKLITENDFNNDNSYIEDLVEGRMSILSELDDAGTGQIYNFPSLEELINTKKNNNNNSLLNVYSNHSVENEISERYENVGTRVNHHQDNQLSNSDNHHINQNKIRNQVKAYENLEITKESYDMITPNNEDIKDNQNQILDDNSTEKNVELTDRINISDYSINYNRDSITPNLPGAFLSVVMKNLSSVNFPEETKTETDDNIQIPKLELNDKIIHVEVGNEEMKSVQDTTVEESTLDKEVTSQEQNPRDQNPQEQNPQEQNSQDQNPQDQNPQEQNSQEQNSQERNFQFQNPQEQNSQDQNPQDQNPQEQNPQEQNPQEQNSQEQNFQFQNPQEIQTQENNQSKSEQPLNNQGEKLQIIQEEIKEDDDSKELELITENDKFETQQIVLTETLTILKDSNNRLSNILITPKRNQNNAGYINKLSPSSESLLKSLHNTKSILNITPQGYTWEEFQSVLNLNYLMESYFNILDFDEIENNNLIKEKNIEEESINNKLLLSQIQNILKEENHSNSEKIQEIIRKYSSEIIKSIKYQIWDGIEKNILTQEFNSEIYHENYSENISKFSTSELATVMAIIVNKSRYGSKNDERVKNELFERISRYFFGQDRNIFFKKSIINWKEKVIFPLKNLLINKFDEMIKLFILKHEHIINNKNRIQNSNVLLSTLESCKLSEMHVYETYWNAMRIVHENITNYKEEIERVKNYLNMMDKKKKNITRLLLKEEELFNSLIMELNDWKVKKNTIRNRLNDLRIKEEFAGFTWELFTMNRFQTIIILNNNCYNHQSDPVKVRISLEWNMNNNNNIEDLPITLNIELLKDKLSINSKYDDLQLQLALVNNQRLEDKIYNAYIEIIEKTLNLRLKNLYLDYKKKNQMNNNILIELIRGIFQSCIVLLWRLESIVFEILNIIKVFNLAIIDIIDENQLILNIPILVGINGKDEEKNYHSNYKNSVSVTNNLSYNYSNSPASPITPNSLTLNNLSPHLLMASRPVISITFNITNSIFISVGTLVNSIEDVSVYNMNDDTAKDMIRVFKDQIKENKKKNSAVYVGYNCFLSVIQNTIQEGGRNQLIWKRPLEKFAPRLLNAVQISKLHQSF